MIDIIMPTCKSEEDVRVKIEEVKTYSEGHNVILISSSGSASVNRNLGLNRATTPIVIMIDDDLCGFYNGWVEDLVFPLKDMGIVFVSARLMDRIGNPGNMVCMNYNLKDDVVNVGHAPTACCAFRNDGLRFCEEYRKSGYEDTHFIMELKEKYGKGSKVVVSNKCKIIHLNEMKGQSESLSHNKAVFQKRWGRYI